MKLIAEIQTLPSEGDVDHHDAYPVRLSLEGDVLTVDAQKGAGNVCFELSLEDLTRALSALSPAAIARIRPVGQGYAQALNPYSQLGHLGQAGMLQQPSPPTRDAAGNRIGPSPRFSMRAKPAPEADMADDFETMTTTEETAA